MKVFHLDLADSTALSPTANGLFDSSCWIELKIPSTVVNLPPQDPSVKVKSNSGILKPAVSA